jgi:hypothetical protein
MSTESARASIDRCRSKIDSIYGPTSNTAIGYGLIAIAYALLERSDGRDLTLSNPPPTRNPGDLR